MLMKLHGTNCTAGPLAVPELLACVQTDRQCCQHVCCACLISCK